MNRRMSGLQLDFRQLYLPRTVQLLTTRKEIFRFACINAEIKEEEIERLILENPSGKPYQTTLNRDQAYNLIDHPPCGDFDLTTTRGKLLYKERYDLITLVA